MTNKTPNQTQTSSAISSVETAQLDNINGGCGACYAAMRGHWFPRAAYYAHHVPGRFFRRF